MLPPQKALQEDAARLVVEAAGTRDPGARERLLAWAAQSDRHGVALAQAELAWETAARLRAISPTEIPREAHAGAARAHGPSGLPRRAVMGGLLAASLAATVLAIRDRAPSAELFATAVGGRRLVALADGTRINLNTDTALRVTFGPAERRVELIRGEAMFDVAHDTARPFRILAGPSRMQVLGTAFNVRMRDQVVELTVSRGAVGVQGVGDGVTQVPAGESAAIRGRTVAVRAVDRQTLWRRTAWQRGTIDLEGETLERAVAEFNRYGDVRIVVADADLAGLRVGGSFGIHDAAAFLVALQKSFDVRVVVAGDGTRLLVQAPAGTS